MQHHYVGDVGDFGKYGLLRALTGEWPASSPRLTLGVVWYLPDGTVGSASDGQKLNYLRKPGEYRDCDEPLFDALKRLVDEGDRSLDAIEVSGVLGAGTTFFSRSIPGGEGPRGGWLKAAVQEVRGCDAVFLDPDKGLAPPSASPNSVEHVHVRELKSFVENGHTVIVYHHLGRNGKHVDQIRAWAEQLEQDLGLDAEPDVLWYRRGTARAYFVVPADAHRVQISGRLRRFEQTLWFKRKHFTPWPPALGGTAPRRGDSGRSGSVEELLASAESETLEFKETARWNVKEGKVDKETKKRLGHAIVKSVCGFLNARGGTLIIGVDDDNKVVGLTRDMETLEKRPNRDGYQLMLQQLFDNGLSVPTAGFVDISFQAVGENEVCVVTVKEYPRPVYAKLPEGGGDPTEFYVRHGNSTAAFKGDKLDKYKATRWPA